MNPSDATRPLTPRDLTNQLFDAAAAQNKNDPHAAARQIIAFLSEALLYAVTSAKIDVIVFLTETLIFVVSSSAVDEAARKELLKQIGDTIANASPLSAGKPEAGKP